SLHDALPILRHARLVALRRHDPHLVRQRARDLFAGGEAGSVDAVVVGDEDAHGFNLSWPGLSRPSRSGRHGLAILSEIAGSSPAMTTQVVARSPFNFSRFSSCRPCNF